MIHQKGSAKHLFRSISPQKYTLRNRVQCLLWLIFFWMLLLLDHCRSDLFICSAMPDLQHLMYQKVSHLASIYSKCCFGFSNRNITKRIYTLQSRVSMLTIKCKRAPTEMAVKVLQLVLFHRCVRDKQPIPVDNTYHCSKDQENQSDSQTVWETLCVHWRSLLQPHLLEILIMSLIYWGFWNLG